MCLSLSPGSYLGLEAGQLQGLQACGAQPNRVLQWKLITLMCTVTKNIFKTNFDLKVNALEVNVL